MEIVRRVEAGPKPGRLEQKGHLDHGYLPQCRKRCLSRLVLAFGKFCWAIVTRGGIRLPQDRLDIPKYCFYDSLQWDNRYGRQAA
jgi:hypothetical protein